jgi:tripartite-type tricarboxylate transporter receptor subunit TctC
MSVATGFLRAMAVASMLIGTASPALAQEGSAFPSRQVTFVVAFPPGGGADILGRVIANQLNEKWKQPVIVENRPGAAGTIAANAVANAQPDGYTWLVGASGAVTSTIVRNLTPVSLLSVPPLLVTVNAAQPINTLGDLIALAKAQPEKVLYASSGPGSSTHLTGELFMELTGTKLTHVPYKGMGQAVGDLLGGQVTVMFGPPPVMLPHVRGGKLRALALASSERSPLYPEIPTAAEQGLPGFEAGVWYGILAPAKTPRNIVDRVSADVAAVLRSPAVAQALESIGATGIGSSPQAFAEFLEKDIARMEELLKKAGVKPPGQ